MSDTATQTRELLDPDNPDQELIHICPTKAQRVLNPIIDWDDDDVWQFIKSNNLRYCKLYDEGYTRLGCIGCCMAGKHQEEELERCPKYKAAYLRAFERMLKERKERGLETQWQTAQDVYDWWIGKNKDEKADDLIKEHKDETSK